jgi:hypothetical protein
MSNMIKISGQGLQRKYGNGIGSSNLLTDADRNQQKKDRDALRASSRAKREAREKRQAKRMAKNVSPEKAIEILEQNPTADIDVQSIHEKALEQTNVIARQYGLQEPNNPEALKHDRFHCSTCDRKLDSPNAHKGTDVDGLFDDEDIRLMCCWCFGKMSDSEIKSTMKIEGAEADAEIRLKVYNPIESTKAEVESLVGLKKIQMKAKLKKWQQDTALVGNVKHDYLLEGDQLENSVLYNAKTRYTACTW